MMQLLWMIGLTYSVQFCIQAHAYILLNLHGVFSFVYYLMIGTKMHPLEYCGTFLEPTLVYPKQASDMVPAFFFTPTKALLLRMTIMGQDSAMFWRMM